MAVAMTSWPAKVSPEEFQALPEDWVEQT